MSKRVLAACAAICTCLALPAAAQDSWQFSYTGFRIQDTGQFEPRISFDGAFRGSDADHDGTLELGELENFWWNGYSYFESAYSGCYGAYCSLKAFRYELGTGQLSFDAEWSYSDEAAYSRTKTITGVSHTFHGESGYRPPISSFTTVYLWTDQTRFAISPPPVDEPPILALLPAGLLLGAALVRMRARSPLKAPR
jgi:hypothetical protein